MITENICTFWNLNFLFFSYMIWIKARKVYFYGAFQQQGS